MKVVALVLPNLLVGGTQKVIINLANGLDPEKFKVFLIVTNSLKSHAHPSFSAEKTLLDLIDLDKVDLIQLNKKGLRWSLFALRRTLADISPDIVLSSLSYVNLFISIFRFILPSKPCYIARESNILTVKHRYLNTHWAINIMYKYFYRQFDKIICQSEDMLNDLIDNISISPKKLLVINNPINAKEISSRISDPIEFDPRYKHIVCVSHLSYQKGHDLLLRALTKVRTDKWKCHLIGRDSGMREILTDIIEQEPHLDNKIYFHGFRSNPYNYLVNADLFVLPSRFEGFPNVLLEAGSLGIPLVAFNNPGGMAEIINSDEIGHLANPNDTLDLARKIELGLNSHHNQTAIRNSILSRYDSSVIIPKFQREFDT